MRVPNRRIKDVRFSKNVPSPAVHRQASAPTAANRASYGLSYGPAYSVASARMKPRSFIGRSRWLRERLYHAIHCTNAPGSQQSRLRRIVEKRKEVKRPLTKPSATPAR